MNMPPRPEHLHCRCMCTCKGETHNTGCHHTTAPTLGQKLRNAPARLLDETRDEVKERPPFDRERLLGE